MATMKHTFAVEIFASHGRLAGEARFTHEVEAVTQGHAERLAQVEADRLVRSGSYDTARVGRAFQRIR